MIRGWVRKRTREDDFVFRYFYNIKTGIGLLIIKDYDNKTGRHLYYISVYDYRGRKLFETKESTLSRIFSMTKYIMKNGIDSYKEKYKDQLRGYEV